MLKLVEKTKQHTMDIVREVLEKQQKENEKYKSIEVEKHEEVNVDVGNLLVTDGNSFDDKELK